MAAMKAMQVARPGGNFELVNANIPEPGPGWVRIKVEACGICHSDMMMKDGLFPGIQFPATPGHEIAGRVDKAGGNVTMWQKGQRVGVGWHGGHCFTCEPCRRGDFMGCQNAKVTGASFPGGYAEYMVAPQDSIALIPDGLKSADAAPLMCAGVTMFNSFRNSGARPGDLVAVLGVGGLGHLAIQFARKSGCKTVALSRGADKAALAHEIGAHEYIDTSKGNPADALMKMGGANVILATAPSGPLIASLIDGLAFGGKMVVLGIAMDKMQLTALQLISGKRSIMGWPAGTAKDIEDTLNFSVLNNVKPMIETFPLEKAQEAYDRMITNKARFRCVLTMP